MSNGIIPFDDHSIQGAYTLPNTQSEKLTPSTIQGIINAWDNLTILDTYGRPWINSKGIHVVLRTSKDNAAYLVAGLADDQKYKTGADLFIRGESICYLLDTSIINARSMLRENYIKYSQLLYIAIRDCSRARELRGEHYEYIKKIVRTLKNKRINEYHINYDELTNEVLHGATAEFSHIRSVSLYPQLASHLDNGFVVNKDTHKIITKNSINDESELRDLCMINNWNVNWYDKYNGYIRNITC